MSTLNEAVPGSNLGYAEGRALAVAGAGFSPLALIAALLWVADAAVVRFWPETDPIDFGQELSILFLVVAMVLAAGSASGNVLPRFGAWARGASPWFVALTIFFAAWEIATAKTGSLPLPFFPSPQAVLEVYFDDWQTLGQSILASGWLFIRGYIIGAFAGILIGIAMGWWRQAGYWIHPVLRFIGPVPATAWLPLIFFIAPSSEAASVFVIVLGVTFPVAVLTWSGIASVNRDYYDVARTLGASERFLILKVAIPSALPHIFVGLFMGLGVSFAVLVVAEMLGVKAGLGWYLSWAQGWAAYGNMYADLVLIAVLCSALITVLFRIRDRLLSWQKGLVQW